jgi:HTH-type transcriptional regulator, competence development regulator
MEKRYKKEVAAFGKRLKVLRGKAGLTQLDLEVESGISRTEISKIENGQINISFMTIVKLAEALDLEISVFFDSNSFAS